jgi:hypothetical protein
MRFICELVTSDFTFQLYIQIFQDDTIHVGIISVLTPVPGYDLSLLRSSANPILVEDLRKLIKYLENHISLVDLSYESHVFMPICSSFKWTRRVWNHMYGAHHQ